MTLATLLLAAGEGGGVQFPRINELVLWPDAFGEGTFYAFNKIALISVIAMVVPTILLLAAGSKAKLVPTGVQNVAESLIDFVENQVIKQAIGPDGKRYLPLLLSLFFFIWIGNLFEVIPTSHMPANARMANPVILALIAWAMFIGVGLKHHGIKYLTGVVWPHSVPVALRPLIGLIEFISVFLVRPFSLAVRLFANMLAGHILLVTFGVLCITLWGFTLLNIVNLLSFPMLVAFTGFEFGVAFLQAYIFCLLTAVYIGGALHPEH